MKKFISDAKTAIDLYKEIRRARKKGKRIEVRCCTQMPFINPGPSFYGTMEGCMFANGPKCIFESAYAAFNALTFEEKHSLGLAPKDGEFVARANFWRKILKPVMPPSEHRTAMSLLLHKYVCIKRMRTEC